jgi:hypothetical protein
MVNARNSHANAYGVFISLEGWRTLAGGNTPGNRRILLRPERLRESTLGYPIKPISPIPSKSTLARLKSTVDLGCEPLIKVEISLISPLSPTCYRPIIRPENKGIKSKSNRHKPQKDHWPLEWWPQHSHFPSMLIRPPVPPLRGRWFESQMLFCETNPISKIYN